MSPNAAIEWKIITKHDDISRILTRYTPSRYREDAVSELRLNMLLKMRRYNPDRSKSLRQYLWAESKFHVKYISQKFALVKTPIRDHSLHTKIVELYEKLSQKGEPCLKDIANQLKTPVKTVERVVNAHRSKGVVKNRINMIIENIYDTSQENFNLEVQESFDSLYRMLKSLNKFERICICLYFGIDGTKLSKAEIARVLGISKADVDKHIKRALKYMRKNKDQIIPL